MTGSPAASSPHWAHDEQWPELATAGQLLSRHRVGAVELDLVRQAGAWLGNDLTDYIDQFYTWMVEQPEFALFFNDPQRLQRVKRMQLGYWQTFFGAEVDERYVRYRHEVGAVHARVGLGLPAYFAAMDVSLLVLGDMLAKRAPSQDVYLQVLRAMTRLVHIDTAIVVEAYSRIVNEKIGDQARSILEMSTPVTALWEDILMLPVVGIVDSRRAHDIMRSVLTRIAETRAQVFIMDISGVSVMDTAVANHLIKVTKATRLMGCECLLSGLSPAIAQTIVELGIDVGSVQTRATLRDALEEAFRRIGIEIRRTGV